MKFILSIILVFSTVLFAENKNIQKFRQDFIEKNYTFETTHFRVHYEDNLETQAREVATILENLYETYRTKYGITLPTKTEVLVADEAISNGWALAIQNIIGIWVHDFDWNLRGSPNWLENVVAHEYAHIASISTSYKMPAWMPYIQAGVFSHANKPTRAEVLYIYPNEVLPPWFFEGIAQYESTMQDGDYWDSHRDMIFRQLVLNDNMLTWDEMSVFNGRFDNYEKTYNHGFALVKYIAETYGYETVVSILKESSRFGRMVFDNAIKKVMGISGRELYDEWKQHLNDHYRGQLAQMGDTTEGQIISFAGYNNYWPKFSNDEKKIYYLSNHGSDHPRMYLHSYNMIDTVKDSTAFRLEVPSVTRFYTLHPDSEKVLYSSVGTPDKFIEHFQWQDNLWDLYEYPLSPDTVKPKFRRKKITRLTEMKNRFNAVYSGVDSSIAAVFQDRDRAYLTISKDRGKTWETLYPDTKNDTLSFHSIYSMDWSPDGSKIALGYLDRNNRKVGYYDLQSKKFYVVTPDEFDSREPRFSFDSKSLYYSSNCSNFTFNIFRYRFEYGTVEQLTNAVGGAFTPDVNNDESRLLYSSYTPEGYSIFLLDSFTVIESKKVDLVERDGYAPKNNLLGGIPQRYNVAPRKGIVIPTVISEEVLTDTYDPYKGIRQTKTGAIVQLVDPMAWREGRGNTMMFFFLTESYFKQLGNVINGGPNEDFDLSRLKLYATDIGVMGMSEMFPFDLQASYFVRNIPSSSPFVHNSYGYDTLEYTNYSIQPSMVDFQVSYPVGFLDFNYYFSFFNYKVQVDIGTDLNNSYLNYDPSRNIRNGLVVSHKSMDYTSNMNISSHHTVAKLQYEYNDAKYVDPDEALIVEDGRLKENYDFFNYHIFKGALIRARSSFLNPKIDFEWGVNGSYLIESNKNDKSLAFPSLYVPAVQVPGYSYFYQSHLNEYILETDVATGEKDTVYLPNDSVVASGRAIAGVQGSYRFPLYPGVIGKKLGFIYLDKLFGAVNGGGVLTANSGSDMLEKSWDDWLFYVGAEVRLSTIAFNTYPLAVKFRWDQGLSRDDPIAIETRSDPVGGPRFTFALGFQFDNWTIVAEPDGIEDRFKPYHMR